MKTILYSIALGVLTGCSLAGDFVRPEGQVPSEWRSAPDGSAAIETAPRNWAANFTSEELESLIREALQKNYDLQAALQRSEQARATVQIARSPLFPQANIGGSFSRDELHRGSRENSGVNSYRAVGSVAYEVDLWGANRNDARSAAARAQATAHDFEALRLVVASDTASAYASLLAAEDRLRVANKNAEYIREILEIAEARFGAGRSDILEVSQQRSALASAEAAIASLEADRDASLHRLAVLIGRPPQSLAVNGTSLTEIAVPEIALPAPETLLNQRPDILAAEADLAAANFDIGVARAALYPALNLGFDLISAASPASASASLATSLASALSVPIFRGGALTGNVERARAREAELVASYQATLLQALREVEDALTAARAAAERVRQLTIASEESDRAYSISRSRYEAGSIDFQALLDTQRDVLQTEDALIRARLEAIVAAVQLYKALGGAPAASIAV